MSIRPNRFGRPVRAGKQKSQHAEVRRLRTGRRKAGILWEYNGDGRFATERIKNDDKRYWRRWTRRQEALHNSPLNH